MNTCMSGLSTASLLTLICLVMACVEIIPFLGHLMKFKGRISLPFWLIVVLTIATYFYGITQGQISPTPNKTQLPKFEHEGQCGNPLYESSLWFVVTGRVVEVLDGSTITIVLHNKARRRVHLVATATPDPKEEIGKASRKMLTDLVLGKIVEVMVAQSNYKAKELTGVVHTSWTKVNQKMIELGLVRYKTPEAYTMSDYTSCIYRIIEAEAQKAKRGLWQQAEISQPAERKP